MVEQNKRMGKSYERYRKDYQSERIINFKTKIIKRQNNPLATESKWRAKRIKQNS